MADLSVSCGLTATLSLLGSLLLPRDSEKGGAVQCHAQHLPGNEVRGPKNSLFRTSGPGLGQGL